jgi:hypothetical protein
VLTCTTLAQNSIRHNLSLNRAFLKVPRNLTDTGKGSFWTIQPEYEALFINGVLMRRHRSGRLISPPSGRISEETIRRRERKRLLANNSDQSSSATSVVMSPSHGSPQTSSKRSRSSSLDSSESANCHHDAPADSDDDSIDADANDPEARLRMLAGFAERAREEEMMLQQQQRLAQPLQ